MTTHPAPWQASSGHHARPRGFTQSSKLQDVLYEIRGPVHEHASRLEAEGHRILKLNIGNAQNQERPRYAQWPHYHLEVYIIATQTSA